MKQLLAIFFLSLTICSYSQNNNITIKLISYRVMIKPFSEGYSDLNKNYGLDLSGSIIDEGVKNNMGLQLSTRFASDLYNAAIDGKIKVYDPFTIYVTGHEINFSTIMNPREVFSQFNYRDSGIVVRPYPPYEEVDTLFSKDFNPEDVVALDFYESWTINEKTLGIQKKIIGICPVIAAYGFGTKEFHGLRRMFWVKM